MDWLAGGDDRRSKLKGIPLQIVYTHIYICTLQVYYYCNVPDDYVSEPVAREPRTDAKTAIGRRVFVSVYTRTDGRTDKLARKRARRGGLTTIRHTATGDRKRCSLYIILCGSRPASGPRVRAYLYNIVRTRSAKTRTRDRLSISSCTYRKLPLYARPPRSVAAVKIYL